MCVTRSRHTQITQSNKFAISLQYEWVNDEVDFLHADKHESSCKLMIWFLMGMVKHTQSFQNSKFAMSLQYLKKKTSEMKLIFCMQINIKVSCKLISTLWASKLPTRWYHHYWWIWSSILKVLKVKKFAVSLKYL